jgi:hypothetical protein
MRIGILKTFESDQLDIMRRNATTLGAADAEALKTKLHVARYRPPRKQVEALEYHAPSFTAHNAGNVSTINDDSAAVRSGQAIDQS